MKIIIVEDDYLQSQLLKSELSFKLKNVSTVLLETESDFRNGILGFESNLPDLFIIDIMLRWTDSSKEITEDAPEDVLDEGFYTAGFRCQKIISENKKLQNIPIILYSVLDKVDLRDRLKNIGKTVYYLPKDKEFEPLIDLIKDKVKV